MFVLGRKTGFVRGVDVGVPSRSIPGFQVSSSFAGGKYGPRVGAAMPIWRRRGGCREVGQKCGSTPAQAASTMLVAVRTVRKGHASQGWSGVGRLSATLSTSMPSSRSAVSSRGRREARTGRATSIISTTALFRAWRVSVPAAQRRKWAFERGPYGPREMAKWRCSVSRDPKGSASSRAASETGLPWPTKSLPPVARI